MAHLLLTAQVNSPMGQPKPLVLDMLISLQLDDSICHHNNSGLYCSLATRHRKTAKTVMLGEKSLPEGLHNAFQLAFAILLTCFTYCKLSITCKQRSKLEAAIRFDSLEK